MICSALIPTRKRVDRLRRTIASLFSTAADPKNIEVVLRVDDDDKETISEYAGYPSIKSVIGPRLTGYDAMGYFVTEAARAAQGDWVFLIDDDAWLEGLGWDHLLSSVPLTGHVMQAECYHLGQSKYGRGSCGPVGMFVPNRCWEPLGYKMIASPADQFWYDLLIRLNQWKTLLMPWITYRHDRDDDETLRQHKAL